MMLIYDYDLPQKKLDKLKLSYESKFLGSGIDGDVYESDDGYAIKFASLEEAKIAKKFLGKKLSYFVKIYSVTRLRKNLYAIKMEKLDKCKNKRKLKNPEEHIHVQKGLKSLLRLGYKYIDMHENNVMYNKKTKRYNIIDVASLRKIKK